MNWQELINSAPAAIALHSVNAVFAVSIFFAGKWLARRLIELVRQLMLTRGLDPTVGGFLCNIGYMAMLGLVIIAALSQLGIPTASFIAVIGAAGLAIGLALQGSLSNFASGVLLVSFKPCRVGDYIEGAGVAGTVQQITVFSTTLRTPDQKLIAVPNSALLNGPIINYSMSETRRLDMTIQVAHGSDVAVAKAVLEQLLQSDERVLRDPEATIGVLSLGVFGIEMAMRPWVRASDYGAVRFDLQDRMQSALAEKGIQLARAGMAEAVPASK